MNSIEVNHLNRIYRAQIGVFNRSIKEVVAVEDTPANVAAAKAAGICTVATPSEATAGQDFSAADLVVTSLLSVNLESLQALLDSPLEPALAGDKSL